MIPADLTRRINDNINWALIVQAGRSPADMTHNMDIWTDLQKLWKESDETFVVGVFLLLLMRPADPAGLAAFLGALANGMPRSELVRTIATSEEARLVDLDVSWLDRLVTPPPKPPSRATVKSLIRRALRRASKLGASVAKAVALPRASFAGAKHSGKGES